jgi:hypothetical protein
MKLNLFFLKDKVMVEGPKPVHVSELENMRKELLSGVFIARKVSDETYFISMNRLIEEDVRIALKKGTRNMRGKIYKLLQCREPAVIDGVIARIENEPSPEQWNNAAWLYTLRKGIYSEEMDGQSGAILDSMVHKGRIEYESYGTYSLAADYMKCILDKDEVYISWLFRYLDCKEESIVAEVMDRLGYDRDSQKYVKRHVKAIGFIA